MIELESAVPANLAGNDGPEEGGNMVLYQCRKLISEGLGEAHLGPGILKEKGTYENLRIKHPA